MYEHVLVLILLVQYILAMLFLDISLIKNVAIKNSSILDYDAWYKFKYFGYDAW